MADEIENKGVGIEPAAPSGDNAGEPKAPDNRAIEDRLAAMEAKHRELLDETKAAKEAKRKAEAESRAQAEKAARAAGNAEEIERLLTERMQSELAEREQKLTQLQNALQSVTISAQSQSIASAIALPGSEKLIATAVRSRLAVEVGDGVPTVYVTDESGKRSKSSIDDLIAEIKKDPAYAPILRATSASGGASTPPQQPGGAGSDAASLRAARIAAIRSRNPNL